MHFVFFIILGACAALIQCLFFREIFPVFQGVDIIAGFFAAAVVSAYSAGFYSAAVFKNAKRPDKFLFFLICAAAAVFTLSFLFIQNIRSFLHIPSGGGISLKISFFCVFAAAFPANFILASALALLPDFVRFRRLSVSNGVIFCFVVSGFAAAAFLYAFFMTGISALRLCGATVILAGFSLPALLKSEKDLLWLFGVLTAAVLFVNTDFVSRADKKLLEKSFAPASIEDYRYSSYGQTVLVQKNGEYSLLTNNILNFSSPDDDILNSEDFGHIPILHVKNPESVLIIGSAAKYLPMILNYGVKKADYTEADDAVIEIIKSNPGRFGRSFNDKRVSVNNLNARDFLKNRKERYDLILIGLGLPANLRANGFYSKEFFQKAEKSLKPDGILALKLPGRMVYSGYIMAELNAGIAKTLKSVFKNVKIIPGRQNILIASNVKMPFRFEIKKRLAEVQETVLVLSKYYLDDRMDTQKTKWLSAELKKAHGKVSENSDLNPQGFINSVLYSQSGFSPRLSVFLDKTGRYSYAVMLVLAFLLFPKSVRKTAALSSGAACVWLFLTVLFYFRITNGQIFKLGAVFCACFALGAAAAVFFDGKLRRVTSLNKKVFNCELAFILLAAFLYFGLKFFELSALHAAVFVFALGFAGAFEFLKLSEIPALLKSGKEKNGNYSVAAHIVFGSLAACIAGGSFLIFVWGPERSVLFVLFFKFITFCRWADIGKRGL
jgi:spermidine synthase